MSEQALPHLQFINPVGFEDFGKTHSFVAEDNFYATVRKGDKWYERLDQDDCLEAWGCSESHYGLCGSEKGCEFIGTGVVEFIWCGPLKRIPAYILQFEHNDDCKSWKGIRRRLDDIYGKVDKDTTVTGIIFSDVVA